MTKDQKPKPVEAPKNINFYLGGADAKPVLTITDSGFYVRGKKVKQGPGEAQEVYEAFKAWLKAANQNVEN